MGRYYRYLETWKLYQQVWADVVEAKWPANTEHAVPLTYSVVTSESQDKDIPSWQIT